MSPHPICDSINRLVFAVRQLSVDANRLVILLPQHCRQAFKAELATHAAYEVDPAMPPVGIRYMGLPVVIAPKGQLLITVEEMKNGLQPAK